MKNSETGEFELVLGNKQLLSGFFIVVILFGVFFIMGYVVGRSQSPSTRLAAGEPAPPVSDAANPSGAGSPMAGPAPREPAAAPAADQPRTPSASEPVSTAAPPEAAKPVETAAAPAPEPAKPAEPIPGETYLQVMAVKRPEAEVVMKTLRDKGFQVVLGPGPNDLVRVLVGPFGDGTALGSAKASLENAGFHPIVRR